MILKKYSIHERFTSVHAALQQCAKKNPTYVIFIFVKAIKKKRKMLHNNLFGAIIIVWLSNYYLLLFIHYINAHITLCSNFEPPRYDCVENKKRADIKRSEN